MIFFSNTHIVWKETGFGMVTVIVLPATAGKSSRDRVVTPKLLTSPDVFLLKVGLICLCTVPWRYFHFIGEIRCVVFSS